MIPVLRELDATLKAHGGMARSIIDDGFAVGPPEVVFPALKAFAEKAAATCGAEFNVAKSEAWSPTADLEALRDGGTLDGFTSSDAWNLGDGLAMGAIPFGTPAFIKAALDDRMQDIRGSVTYVTDKLIHASPHCALAMLQRV